MNAGKEMFQAQTEWIIRNRTSRNIQFVLHLGDIVYNTGRTYQWEIARECLCALNGRVPYALCAGNHDGCERTEPGAPNNTELYNTYFPWSAYKSLPSTGGAFETDLAGPMDNTYHYFTGGGVEFMILSIEFCPHEAVIDWVNDVLSDRAHAEKKVIVITHGWLKGGLPPVILGSAEPASVRKICP